MATMYTYYQYSGTNTPRFDGDYRYYFVDSNTQDSSSNSSTITVKCYVDSYGFDSFTSKLVTASANINGTVVSVSKSLTLLGGGPFYIGQVQRKITHNSDGTKTISLYSYATRSGDTTMYTSERTFALPQIPRTTTINSYSVTAISPKEFEINWSAANTCDRVEYRLNNGSWLLAQSGDRSSGTFSITGLNPNTAYIVQIRVRRKDSQVWTSSSNSSRTTHKLCTITSNVNFIIENDIPITVDRQNEDYLCNITLKSRKLETDEWIIIKTIENIETSTTMTLNSTEQDLIYNLIPDISHALIRFEVETLKNEVSYGISNKDGTATIIDANPIFSHFIFGDVNPTTLALTGSAQTMIKGYSNLEVRILNSNKAIGQKGATIVKYQLVVGTKQATVDYQDTGDTIITLDNIDNNVFIVYAIDSRNNSTTVQKSPTNFIDYSNPIVTNVLVERTGNIQPETTLSFSGTFSNIDFGTEVNQITATYKYSKTDVIDFIDGTTELILTKDGNTFTCEQLIAGDLGATGFDTKFSYYIEVEVQDLVWNGSDSAILSSGIPNIAIHKKGVGINGEYNPTLPDGLQVSGEFTQNEETLILNEPFAKQALVFTALSFGVYTATIKHEIEEGLIIDCYFPPADVNTDIVELSLIEEEPAIPLVDALDTNIIASEIENTYQKIVYKNGKFLLMKEEFKKVLYNDSTGTTGDVTLSETSANFKYLEIFYRHGASDTAYSSLKVFEPNSKRIDLFSSYDNGTYLYIYSENPTISGNKITRTTQTRWRYTRGAASYSSSIITRTEDSVIYITRVIGYR